MAQIEVTKEKLVQKYYFSEIVKNSFLIGLH